MSPQNTNIGGDLPEITDRAILKGRQLAHPPPGEEVVISGISGRYPDSDDVEQFKKNLYNKVDLVSDDNRRWVDSHPEIPHRTGKINKLEKFDAGFFGLHHRMAEVTDPMCRMILEKSVEAIYDAGVHPKELEGGKTGVFVGACYSESEKNWFYDRPEYGEAIIGNIRAMIANRVSHFLKVDGPSFTVDTACSSSLYGFENAYRAIRNGECDNALVGGVNLCMHPYVSLQFARLGVLSKDGCCKCFDNTANGYARSETVAVVFLQKAKDSKRIYSTVVHAKTNCDGYKEQGITYPSGEVQKKLLEEFYEECQVDPSTLSFVEAHGTGTKVGDPEEVGAIDEVFCKNRRTPLLIGSVKCSIGHTEPASGLCSITKVIIAMENGLIPPNIYYNNPRDEMEGIRSGRMKIVTEKTPFPDKNGLVGINSFGFGGGNCHILLRWNQKQKIAQGVPKDDLPRLVCVSGRSEESITSILDQLKNHKLDSELVALYHDIHKYDIPTHNYRGYSIVTKNGEVSRSLQYYPCEESPLCFVFGGYDPSWLGIGSGLFQIPIFAGGIQKLHKTLQPLGVNLTELLTNNKKVDVIGGIVAHVATQLVLVDMLKTLHVEADLVMGKSLGVIAAAYYDSCLTMDQAILCAHHIAVWAKEVANNTNYVLAQIKLPLKKVLQTLPKGVEVVDDLSQDVVVVSGPSPIIGDYLKTLHTKNVDFKEYPGQHLGFNHKNTATLSSKLLQKLSEVVPQPKQFKSHFLSTSILKQPVAMASPEFFVVALTTPIASRSALEKIATTNSVVVEFGESHLKVPLKELNPNSTVLSFTENDHGGVISFVGVLGKLYETGRNPQLEKLYPKIQYPVSRGTPMIAPVIKWNHTKDWFAPFYKSQEQVKNGERAMEFFVKDDEWQYLMGHVIDGRNLFPATGYLLLVWETLSMMIGMMMPDFQVVFENVKYLRATTIPQDAKLEFVVMVQQGSGNFEVFEGGSAVVTGRVFAINTYMNERLELPTPQGVPSDKALPMTHKDIYKELKLRGYNYSGIFKSIMGCDSTASKGSVKWHNNWAAFMDNMLQMQILQVDTRNLYVPTSIKRLTIDAKRHIAYCQQLGEEPEIPVYCYKETNIIRAGAIEVRGLNASSIARRKPLGEPVLETYKFVPNTLAMTLQQSMRVDMQIVLENSLAVKIKVVELVDNESGEGYEPLGPIIHEVLGDQPLIQPEIVVLSKTPMEVTNVSVEDRKLSVETDCMVVVATNITSRPQILKEAFGALKPNGFVVSRENLDFDETTMANPDFDVLTVHALPTEKIVMLRKTTDNRTPITIDVGTDDFEWLPTLQKAMKSDNRVVVYAQNQPLNGIVGLVNCVRREPGGDKVQCVFVMGEDAPQFDPHDEFYKKQLKKDMAVNIYKDGKWGTYRHLLLDELPLVEREHCYVNVTVRGDLSSLRWIEGPLTSKTVVDAEKTLVNIYYSALNFRDVMTASGRIGADVITMVRTEQECVQSFEFSGRDMSGRRVMGMVTSGALATLLTADSHLLWEVPDKWSLEDAATVPVVYGTVLYAFFVRGNIKPGDSVLIHAGTGGVGQAAISIALHHGCRVFTTVGTKEKRDYLKKRFPQLDDRHIGNTRDTTFEDLILTETDNRGVDFVLNSLAEEKLQASFRCLAKGGKFLEIGKFDLANDNPISLQLFDKEASFHGIMLDGLFMEGPSMKKLVTSYLVEGIANGSVVPLPRTVFKDDEIENAFRFMAAGKHMGKVVIKLKDEETQKRVLPKIQMAKGIPRYFCNSDYSCVITGGLGGFGLELADWLVLRGCRKLVLTSRSGIKTGYQESRIRIWRSYGTTIRISTADITTEKGCRQLLEEATSLGPIEAIFNLAVVLKDAILENQTLENFVTSFGPKAYATHHLDQLSRTMCPQLRDFVIFSSVSCGRGNPGQTNYGMANSVMERICERRKNEGYPALAIEWGAIGEVGLVAEMQEGHGELEIGGTLQQRISSCLTTLDIFLRQNEPIVSSMVVAEKRSGLRADNVVDCVANIMGVNNLKTISLHSTLAELGMDSIMAVEIKQALEREFEVFLTPQDIRGMTFAKLQDIQNEKEADVSKVSKPEVLPEGIQLMLRHIAKEETAEEPVVPLVSLVDGKLSAPTLFIIPGIEGSYNVFEGMASRVNAHVKCLQLGFQNHKDTLQELALQLLPHFEANQTSKKFVLLAYSFGTMVALELVAILERKGYIGEIIFMDGSPEMMLRLVQQQLERDSTSMFETGLLCYLMTLYMPNETVMKIKEAIEKCETYEQRVQIVLDNSPNNTPFSREYQQNLAIGIHKRIMSIVNYKPSFAKLKSKLRLMRPSSASVLNIANDYRLSDYTEDTVEVNFVEGNHITMVDNPKITEEINKVIGTMTVENGGVTTKAAALHQRHLQHKTESLKQI